MRILHCCLAAFYIDNYSYQENILPRIHSELGYEVQIVASTETYITKTKIGYVEPSSYISSDGIKISRLGYNKLLPHFIMKKLRIYVGLSKILDEFKPDIIFLHDVQFIDVSKIIKYAKKNPKVKIFADCHTDFINSARNWFSKNILHGIIYKHCANLIEPYTKKFFGVLPARMDFLKEMYKLPDKKIELLVMGADDSKINFDNKKEIRNNIREKLNISNNDFLMVTGGKIDKRKNIHLLLKAVSELNKKDIKLILFGLPDEDMKIEIDKYSNNKTIRNIGWIESNKVYDFFLASDLAIFPGTHSVLWEQAVGTGLPCVFRKWKGFEHVDIGGNCKFIYNDNVEEIKDVIMEIYNNKEIYNNMKNKSFTRGREFFSYIDIAKRAIGL